MLEINRLKEIQSFGTVSFAGQKATVLKKHFMHIVHSYAYDYVEVHLLYISGDAVACMQLFK